MTESVLWQVGVYVVLIYMSYQLAQIREAVTVVATTITRAVAQKSET